MAKFPSLDIASSGEVGSTTGLLPLAVHSGDSLPGLKKPSANLLLLETSLSLPTSARPGDTVSVAVEEDEEEAQKDMMKERHDEADDEQGEGVILHSRKSHEALGRERRNLLGKGRWAGPVLMTWLSFGLHRSSASWAMEPRGGEPPPEMTGLTAAAGDLFLSLSLSLPVVN
uniref:Uncharacterized protein n=1 Tax=Oryza glumipatula TaxID=40148 RepID=A0A0D9ZKP4_9ORYZ